MVSARTAHLSALGTDPAAATAVGYAWGLGATGLALLLLAAVTVIIRQSKEPRS